MNRTRLLVAALVLSAAGCGADAAGTAPSSVPPSPADATTATTEPARPVPLETSTTRPPAAELAALADMAVVSRDGQIVVVRHGVMSSPVEGMVAADRQTLISVSHHGVGSAVPTTTVAWVRLTDDIEQGRTVLAGELDAIATDPTGRFIALTGPAPDGGTEVVIAAPHGEVFRRAYAEELLPEGFGNVPDGSLQVPIEMFVVEYLDPPPADASAPRRYRVRVLDTSTGELGLPFNLRNKGQTVDEQMLGFGRTHVLSPSNGLLFTLYRGIDADEANYAFVHTLGFVNGVWCLQLPLDLDLGNLPGAVVLVDGESRLLVASANGYMSEFVIADITASVQEPAPRRTEPVWRGGASAGAPALASSGHGILVGQDEVVRWVDAATLTVVGELRWDMQVEAVALLANDDAIAAGTGRISQISPAGDLLAELPLPGGFGPVATIALLDAAG